MKIALLFNNSIQHTTGNYVFDSLVSAGHQVKIINPKNNDLMNHENFDLLLGVDYGDKFEIPKNILYKKSAIWLIDTHLHFIRYFFMATKYDYIYCAQKRASEKFSKLGMRAMWLPLGFSSTHHTSSNFQKKYDLAFIGNPTWGIRKRVLKKIASAIENSYVGNCDFRRIGEIYSSSYLVFNISINDDLNMRFFEGIASGSFFYTDNVYGINDIDGFDYRYSYDRASLKNLDRFIEGIKKYIEDIQEGRIFVDDKKLNLFLSKNSYNCRVKVLMDDVQKSIPSKKSIYIYLNFFIHIFFPELLNRVTIFIIQKFDGLKNRLEKF